jgi:zinc protease
VRAWLGVLATVALVGGCVARGSPPPAQTAGPRREVLPNGAVVIVQPHRGAEVVALQLWLRAGARDETDEEVGLAHVLEHMLFKGTPRRPPGSIDRLIEGLGGQSHAFTTHDYTHYDLLLPAAHLRAGVELLADLAAHALVDPGELEAERRVIFEEMRLTEDQPERYLLRRLYQLAYAPHPYGRPLLGTPAALARVTRERVLAWYRQHYVPANMVLVVVGHVDPLEALREARAAFGGLVGARPVRAVPPPPPSLAGGRREDVPRPERQAWLGLAWRAPSIRDPDVYAMDLLTMILGDGPASRLSRTLRDRLRVVHGVEAGYGAWEQAGLVTVTARLDPVHLERAEAAVRAVLEEVRHRGVTEAERERALVTAEATYAFDIETAEGLAKSYGQAEVTWTLADELQYLRRLRRVTVGDIHAVARRYLGDDAYARVRFLPQEAAR